MTSFVNDTMMSMVHYCMCSQVFQLLRMDPPQNMEYDYHEKASPYPAQFEIPPTPNDQLNLLFSTVVCHVVLFLNWKIIDS